MTLCLSNVLNMRLWWYCETTRMWWNYNDCEALVNDSWIKITKSTDNYLEIEELKLKKKRKHFENGSWFYISSELSNWMWNNT
jgi:hypothetical protein